MQPYEYHTMRALEDTYWWYVGLRALVARNAQRTLGNPAQGPTFDPGNEFPGKGAGGLVRCRVLDAGCGSGGNMASLRRALPECDMIGVDFNSSAVELTKQRNTGAVLRASIENLPFSAGSFDLVISLDVLCAKGLDDLKAIRDFHRVLKPQGILILNLPAFDFLRGRHDLAVHTGRRYTSRGVGTLLNTAGFTMQRATYWNSALFVPLVFWRLLSRIFKGEESPRSDLVPLPGRLNSLLTRLILREIQVTGRLSLPFGSSVFTIARKT